MARIVTGIVGVGLLIPCAELVGLAQSPTAASLGALSHREADTSRSPSSAVKRPIVRTVPPSPIANLGWPRPTARPPVWVDAEQQLAAARRHRKEWGDGYHHLEAQYGVLASPASSGSKSLAEHLPHLEKWRSERPKSADARVVSAKALIHYAWEARGSGVAMTVTEEGWKLFHERIALAHQLLDEAIDLGVQDGEAHTRLLNLAYAESQPREVADRWLEAGMKLDPTYFSMYDEMAVYLMPRWGGEPGDIERFAAQIVEKLPGDDGLEAYARIAYGIQHYECGWGETLFRGEYDYPTLVKAAEVFLARHPRWTGAAQFAALCAFVGQDHAAAKRIRPFVGPFNEQDKMWVWENAHKHFMDWSAAAYSPRTEENWVFAGLVGVPAIAFGNERRQVWVAQQFGKSAANLMDMRTNQIELALPSVGGVVNGFAYDTRRQWAVVSNWRGDFTGWTVWDVSGERAPAAHPTAEKCTAVGFHPSEPVVFWLEGKKLFSHNFSTDAAGIECEAEEHLHHLVISADGGLVAANNLVFDTSTGQQEYRLGEPAAGERKMISMRSVLAIDEEGRVWALATLDGKPPTSHSLVRFAADGQTCETLIDDVGDGRAYLSPDRKLLALTPNIRNGAQVSPIDIWNVSQKKRVKQFEGHWNSIRYMAFSPDGGKLATISMWADAVKTWSLDGLAD